MAKLVVITKGLPALSHPLGESWVTIGRGPDNTFQIVEPSVSGKHCEVRLKGSGLLVRDLLSTNGIFVDGKKVIEAVVKTGQTFRVGEVELRFEDSPATGPSGTSFLTKMLVTNVAAGTQKISVATPAKSVPVAQTGDEPAKRNHVLLVDDSMAFLETFSELCSELANRTWQIHSTTAADRALAILKDNPIDLVVVDIGMPMVDGIQLLGIINRRFPGIKIAVMTGSASEARRAEALASGAELFIEKPVSPEGIKIVFNMLNDLVSAAHREGFSGALRSVGLQEVIQMECIGRHSSILEIRNSEMRGQIYIENGTIIHAAVGTLDGERAFHRLLSLKGGEFRLNAFKTPPQRTIEGRWELLLMEAARASDEETASIKKPDAAAEKKDEHSALGDDVVVVATYDGKWTPLDGSKK
jgi:CheY-like chemotaxis protein